MSEYVAILNGETKNEIIETRNNKQNPKNNTFDF